MFRLNLQAKLLQNAFHAQAAARNRGNVPYDCYIRFISNGQRCLKIFIGSHAMLSSKNPYYADMYAYGELMWNNSPYLNLHAEAKNGYGPALYDIALMWAEKRGKWVVPSITANLLGTDRGCTTSEAENVWKFYYQSRPDVKKQDITEIVEKAVQSGSDPDDEEMFNKVKDKPWLLCAYKKKGAIHSIAPIWKPDNARDDYGVPLPGHQPPVTIRRKPEGVLKGYTF